MAFPVLFFVLCFIGLPPIWFFRFILRTSEAQNFQADGGEEERKNAEEGALAEGFGQGAIQLNTFSPGCLSPFRDL